MAPASDRYGRVLTRAQALQVVQSDRPEILHMEAAPMPSAWRDWLAWSPVIIVLGACLFFLVRL